MRLFIQGIGKFTNVEMYGKCIYKRGYNGNIIGYVIWCDWCVWKLLPWNFHGLKHPKYLNFKHTHIASDIDSTQVIPSVCQVLSWNENVGVGPGRWTRHVCLREQSKQFLVWTMMFDHRIFFILILYITVCYINLVYIYNLYTCLNIIFFPGFQSLIFTVFTIHFSVQPGLSPYLGEKYPGRGLCDVFPGGHFQVSRWNGLLGLTWDDPRWDNSTR